MRRLTAALLVLSLFTLLLCGCGKQLNTKETKRARVISSTIDYDPSNPDMTQVLMNAAKPEEIQIRNICQLATLEVYFHNVAKAVKPADIGIFSFNQKDRKFWIEYSGSAQVGIDMGKVKMEMNGSQIKVTMPHASLIGDITIDSSSYDINSVAVESQSGWSENKIEASDITTAIREANSYTKLSIIKNGQMMRTAEQRAMDLIKKYISQIAAYANVDYTVQFEFIENNTSTTT